MFGMNGMDKLADAIRDAATNLARSITQELGRTDRQRVNQRASNILFHGAVAQGGPVILYTVPNNAQTEITEYILTNSQPTGGSNVTVQILLVPPERRNAPTADDVVIPDKELTPSDEVIITANTAILTGWTIQANGQSPGNTNLHISGVEKVN